MIPKNDRQWQIFALIPLTVGFVIIVIFATMYVSNYRKEQEYALQLDTSCSRSVQETQWKILDLINNVRKEVKAANMLKMIWDTAAAAQAQALADTCIYGHNRAEERNNWGQNIAQADYCSWEQTFAAWNREAGYFEYGQEKCEKSDSNSSTGHYTQNIWATSYKIGCGFSPCEDKGGNLFVCHYYPPANFELKGESCKPYLPGTNETGGVCGLCGGVNGTACDEGLCRNPCGYKDDITNCPAMSKSICNNQANSSVVEQCSATCECLEKDLI